MGRKGKTTVNGSRREDRIAVPAAGNEGLPGLEADESADDAVDELAVDDEVEVEAGSTDNVGEQSVEINVQDLLAQLEAESGRGTTGAGCARRRLEDYLEEKRIARDLQDMDDFEI